MTSAQVQTGTERRLAELAALQHSLDELMQELSAYRDSLLLQLETLQQEAANGSSELARPSPLRSLDANPAETPPRALPKEAATIKPADIEAAGPRKDSGLLRGLYSTEPPPELPHKGPVRRSTPPPSADEPRRPAAAPLRPSDSGSRKPPAAPAPARPSDSGSQKPAPVRPSDSGTRKPAPVRPSDSGTHKPAPVRPSDSGSRKPAPVRPSDSGTQKPAPVRPSDSGSRKPAPVRPSDSGTQKPAPIRPSDSGSRKPAPVRPSDSGSRKPAPSDSGTSDKPESAPAARHSPPPSAPAPPQPTRKSDSGAPRSGKPISIMMDSDDELVNGWVVERTSNSLRIKVGVELMVGSVYSIRPGQDHPNAEWVQISVKSCHVERGSFVVGATFVVRPPWTVLALM